MKLIIPSLCTLIFSTATFLYHGFSHSPATCLVQQGYSGDIYIIYGQPNGSAEEYDGNRRVYRIPANGILFTKFSPEGYSDRQYYFVLPDGKKRVISQLSTGDFNEPWSYIKNTKEPSRNSIAIIDAGMIWSMISAKNSFTYQCAFLGTYNQFKSYKGFSLSYIDSLQKNISSRSIVKNDK